MIGNMLVLEIDFKLVAGLFMGFVLLFLFFDVFLFGWIV
jgi:hypothetical protein